MESELFDFEASQGDALEMYYFDVTLKQQIGEFPIGTKFSTVTIDFDKSWLTLKNEQDKMVGRYLIRLQVVKDLLNSED